MNYDTLGRATQVITPDGSSSANNITTSYSGNAVTVTDQAGKQRRSFTDALGRLIQVDEPGPSGGSGGTPGTGSVNIAEAERGAAASKRCHAQPRVAALREEQWVWDCWWEQTTIWDTGGVSITVNGFSKTVSYGYGSTGASVASALAGAFIGDPASPVTAAVNGAAVNLTSKLTGAATSFRLLASPTSCA